MTSEPFAGRYSELQFVGRGGFGAVYRAYDLKLKCIRALKLLNPELAADEDYRERFRREATSAAGLSHPNITVVFDEGIFGDQPYIVMEYVEGEPLSRIIETRLTLDDPARLDLIEQLCDGLHYAHRRGVIHRDIKPVNLLVREDQEGSHVVRTLKILDFGIAKVQNASNTLTGGQLMFTPNYVSPEQIRGFDASPHSDMFAVGAVAYELLVQRKAFNIRPKNQFEIFEELKRKIVEQPHTPMATFRPEIDSELASIIDRALAKDPDARFRDLAEMRRQVAKVRERLERRQSGSPDADGSTVRADPPVVQGDVLLGLQALGADDPEQAVRYFERALAHGVGDATPRALAEPLARARAAVRERHLERARHVREEAVAAFREGRSADAVRLLHAFEPAELVADALKAFTDAAALIATAEQVVASAPADRRVEALEVLQSAGPPTLVGPALARLRASHAQRSAEEAREAAVADVVASARARFENGEADEAIEALERFTPRDTRVLATLAELRERRRASVDEEHARVEAQKVIAEAHTAFAHGDRAAALDMLAAFVPPELVRDALEELTDVDAAIGRARSAVTTGGPAVRQRALDELAALVPVRLAGAALADLRAIASTRTAEEARAEADASARARDAIEQARGLFRGGGRDRAMAALRSFEDPGRVVGALEALQSAAAVIDSAEAAVRTGSAIDRDAALERLASFADRDLVEAPLASLHEQARTRSEAEALEAAADRAIRESRETFWRGERDAAIAQLREFTPRTTAIDTALQELVDIVEAFKRQEKQAAARAEAEARTRAEAAARAVIATAQALFDEGRRADALATLDAAGDHPLIASARADLRRRDADESARERQEAEEADRRAEEHRRAETLRIRAGEAIEAAQENAARGDVTTAIATLTAFSPAHPDVTAVLARLQTTVRVDELVGLGRAALADARPAEATRTAAEALALAPGHAGASALLADARVASRAASSRRARTLAVRVGIPAVVVLALGVGISRFSTSPAEEHGGPTESPSTTTIPRQETTSSIAPLPPTPMATPVDVTLDAQPWARFVVRSTDPNGKQPPVQGVTPAHISLLPGQYIVDLENGGVTQPLRQNLVVGHGPLQRAFVMPGFDADRAATALLADEQSSAGGDASRRVR